MDPLPLGHQASTSTITESPIRAVSKSLLIVSACVVGIPCGEADYVLSVPFVQLDGAETRAAARGDLAVVLVHAMQRGFV
jgi:hypothetical protein